MFERMAFRSDVEDTVLTRSCSYDSSYEMVETPPGLTSLGAMKEELPQEEESPPQSVCCQPPLDKPTFQSMLDPDGRLVNEHALRKAVFRGGVDPTVRKDTWQFMFGLYPFLSTAREREVMSAEHHFKYHQLKARWKTLLTMSSLGKTEQEQGVSAEYLDDDLDLKVESFTDDADMKVPAMDTTNISTETQQQLQFLEIQAQVFAGRQPINMKDIRKAVRIIDKDVPRTDRGHEYFKGSGNPHLSILRNILITFAAFHPKVGYAQGMNDILSRFLVVLDSEVAAFWCFSSYMETIQTDFMEEGMLRKLNLVRQLLKELDTVLFNHLENCDVGDMTFCHRWLLLGFKREFPFEEALRLFEIISSHHMELSSLDVERVRDQERARDFLREGGQNRVVGAPLNTEYTFELFVCVAMLQNIRQQLLNCRDGTEIFQTVSGLSGKMDLAHILRKAETIFMSYCRKSVIDCFQIVE
ncbi:PREDICTED: TBC1 domain family member 17-like [Branchiostoma belcheri]|uniref:TBC1 domain family member 17-like n=1 Tax=Branchiostoma belcheri TaxID=7741 RepID=A0A6P4Y1T6_BRABE|nr:PREDICTED: TBC1 domain family member 17-like [Branchiostoma belcheri]